MMRKWTIPFLGLLMTMLFPVPVLASAEYGVIYDETEQLRSEALQYAGETTLPALTEQYGIDLRVDVLDESDYDTILDAAENIYDRYGYGYGENRSGITLTLLLTPDGDSYQMEPGDWCVYLGGTDENLLYGDWLTDIRNAVAPYMAEAAWSGDMEMSAVALSQAVDAMADAVEDCFGGQTEAATVPEIAQTAEAEDEQEPDEIGYVFDLVPLLDEEVWGILENMAEDVSEQYDCGVYIVTVDDYANYGSGSILEVATQIYQNEDNGFGRGDGRDGIMLLLSMHDRDWALFVSGEHAEYAFNSYGQEKLQAAFLDDFAEDDWYGGFADYIQTCGDYLDKAEDGKPVHESPLGKIGLAAVLSCVAALAVCMVLKRKMKTVRKKAEANAYVAEGGLTLKNSYDRYTHTTETRRKIEHNSGSEGKNDKGGSGKF